MQFFKQKKVVALLAAAAVAITAVGAYAYWTTSGAGTGSATAATTNGITFEITGGSTDLTGLYPGGSVAISNGNVHNGGSQAAGLVSPITGTVSVDEPFATAGCDASWFSVDDTTVPANTSIAAGGDYPFTTTLRMTNDAANQDACKGAALTITWAS
jgi:hypothetical protein